MKAGHNILFNSCLAWFLGCFLMGCAIKEAAKKVMGTSTQTLSEEARTNGLSRSFHCSYQDCFDAVLSMAREPQSVKPWKKIEEPNIGSFDVLMSDIYSNPPYVVVIGVTGNIDTTEVGIFFIRTDLDTIRVSVSSLSSTAKRTISDLVFTQLAQRFNEAE
jgi:hypothetical protein